jgi:hypothetical protein
MLKKLFISLLIVHCSLFAVHCNAQIQLLKIADDKRSFATANGKPFFWLGDTGWLLFKNCTKEEIIEYLTVRKKQGFNVIQVMLLHELTVTNTYGDSALINKNVSKPNTTKTYWEIVDFAIKEAAKRNIYMALVPVWGGNVKSGKVSEQQAEQYASFLAKRYKKYNNIIWLNGGDIRGNEGESVWKIIGKTLKEKDGRHLITFHPRGRSTSSTWFHNEEWLDFNMFQSGHKNYAQDTVEPRMGEDNWKYAVNDFAMQPMKPTMDGEPSYENIPHGLHDSLAARWTAADVRRYAYWNVFAGGAGFTYGENSVMQFKTTWNKDISFGPVKTWKEEMNAEGATQMQYVKKLITSSNFLNRKPAQDLIVNQGERYHYLAALQVKGAIYVYTYTGRNIELNLARYAGKKVKSAWYNPKNGQYIAIENFTANGVKVFDAPGEEKEGNDWVLVITNL